MDNIKNTAKLVKQALINNPKARNSDNYLYFLICYAKLKANGLDIRNISFADGLLHRGEYGFPQFETVRRSRQKIQAEFPELSGTSDVEAMREVLEEDFREFARSGGAI